MPEIFYAVQGSPYLKYDGTNGQDILDLTAANNATYPLAIQGDSSAETLRISIDWSGGDPDFPQVADNFIVVNNGSYINVGGTSVITPELLASQYIVVPAPTS